MSSPYTMQNSYPTNHNINSGSMQYPIPAMVHGVTPGSMPYPNPNMVHGTSPVPMQYPNPAMVHGMSPGTMQYPSPTMVHGMNPAMMQSGYPMMMQSPYPYSNSKNQIYFVPMMMAAPATNKGKREVSNEKIVRKKRSPSPYQYLAMPYGMQSANPMTLQSPYYPYMQSGSPMQSPGMVYMVPMTSHMGMGKREASHPDAHEIKKRSPLSVSPVLLTSPNMLQSPMVGYQNPMLLQSSAPLMMSSPLLAQSIGYGKREAPNPDAHEIKKRSPQSVLLASPNMVPYPMGYQNPMLLQSSAPLMMPSPVLTQPIGYGKREAPNHVPGIKKRSPLSVSPVFLTSPNMLQSPMVGYQNPMLLQSSAPLMMSSPLLAQPIGYGKREAPNPDAHEIKKRSPLSISPVLMTSPNMLQSPIIGYPNPMLLQGSESLMMPSPVLSFGKREALNPERKKRSPLTYSPVLMASPNIVQSSMMGYASPMLLRSSAPLMMSSPLLAQPIGYGKREAPNPDAPVEK